jgi:disulfide bond formation protein DsbB
MGLGLKACPLCFYQRTFVMGVVAVLGIGLLTGERHRAVLNLLALPLVVAGVGVAAFHVFLELTGKLECPSGIMGVGTAPQQSLAVLTVLIAVVLVGVVWSRSAGVSFWPPLAGAVVLGLLLAWGSVVSSPPMPPTPTKAYETPLDMCRPPFHSQ